MILSILKRKHLLVTFFLIVILKSYSQKKSYTLSGIVTDSNKSVLSPASVLLLNPKDSSIISYTTTNSKGYYKFRRLNNKDYMASISFVGYEDKFIPLIIKKNTELNIELEQKSVLLDEVELTIRAPIEYKGDTVQYNAENFETEKRASVEDLLKEIPGIEVNEQGDIFVNGEKIEKILVDGEEFFEGGITTATKNLFAEAVDNLQYYEKGSDFSEFTGVKDPNGKKTINIRLKPNYKKGYFGNTGAEYGTRRMFDGFFSVNVYNSSKLNLGFSIKHNRLNEESFSPNVTSPNLTLTGNTRSNLRKGNSYSFTANYRFNKKLKIRTYTTFNNQNSNPFSSSIREYFTNEENFFRENVGLNEQSSDSKSFNFKLNYNPSSQFSITYDANITNTNNDNINRSQSESFNSENVVTNFSNRLNQRNRESISFNNKFSFFMNFKKKGRSLSLKANFDVNDNKSNNIVQSQNSLFEPSTNISEELIVDQLQNQSNNPISYNIDLLYREPLGKKNYLEFFFKNGLRDNRSVKEFYDSESGDLVFNDTLSTDFIRGSSNITSGIKFRMNKKKITLTSGVKIQQNFLKGELDGVDELIKKDFLNVLPSFALRYNLTKSHRINVNYSTSVRLPSLNQLKPVIENSDALSTYVGNPDLDKELNNNISLRHYYNINSFGFSTSFGANYTFDKIVTSQIINEQLEQQSTPINTNNYYSYNASTSISYELFDDNYSINLKPSYSFSNQQVFTNGEPNSIKKTINSIRLSFRRTGSFKKKLKWSFSSFYSNNKTIFSSSGRNDINNSNIRFEANLKYKFKNNLEIKSSMNFNRSFGNAFQNNENVPYMRIYLTKSFFKKEQLSVKLQVNDLLNRNLGLSRNNNLNYIEETRRSNVSRVFMFTIRYNFRGLIKSKDKSEKE